MVSQTIPKKKTQPRTDRVTRGRPTPSESSDRRTPGDCDTTKYRDLVGCVLFHVVRLGDWTIPELRWEAQRQWAATDSGWKSAIRRCSRRGHIDYCYDHSAGRYRLLWVCPDVVDVLRGYLRAPAGSDAYAQACQMIDEIANLGGDR